MEKNPPFSNPAYGLDCMSAFPSFLRQWLSNSLGTLVWIWKSKLATLEVADARRLREKNR